MGQFDFLSASSDDPAISFFCFPFFFKYCKNPAMQQTIVTNFRKVIAKLPARLCWSYIGLHPSSVTEELEIRLANSLIGKHNCGFCV